MAEIIVFYGTVTIWASAADEFWNLLHFWINIVMERNCLPKVVCQS